MSLLAAFGEAQELDSRRAGALATRRALDKIGGAPVKFGFILISSQHDALQVLSGVTSLLGNTPLFGMNVRGFISGQNLPRTVQVLLLAGQEIQVFADWWPEFSKMNSAALRNLLSDLHTDTHEVSVLLTAQNGVDSRMAVLTEALADKKYLYLGLLAARTDLDGMTYEIGGASAGMDGLAAAVLTGDISCRIYRAHAWKSTGMNLQITHVRDGVIRTINERPALEIYANILGGSSQDWIKPPLNTLVGAYPLAVADSTDTRMQIITPVKFEEDGSLRVNTLLPEGCHVNLLMSSPEASLGAVQHAVSSAKKDLGNIPPIALIIFADQAWFYLLEGRAHLLNELFLKAFGDSVPILAGFSLGQLLCTNSDVGPVLTQGELNLLVLSRQPQ